MVHFPSQNLSRQGSNLSIASLDSSASKLSRPYSPSTRSRSNSDAFFTSLEDRVHSLGPLFHDFDITFVSHPLDGGFGPEAVKWTLEYFNVEVGQLSIGVPGPHFGYRLGELFGVRILNVDPDTSVVNSDPTRALVARSRQNSQDSDFDRLVPNSPQDIDSSTDLGLNQLKPDTNPIL